VWRLRESAVFSRTLTGPRWKVNYLYHGLRHMRATVCESAFSGKGSTFTSALMPARFALLRSPWTPFALMFANVIGGQRDMAAELQAAGPVTSSGTRYGAQL
jgi:hypothetical protein